MNSKIHRELEKIGFEDITDILPIRFIENLTHNPFNFHKYTRRFLRKDGRHYVNLLVGGNENTVEFKCTVNFSGGDYEHFSYDLVPQEEFLGLLTRSITTVKEKRGIKL